MWSAEIYTPKRCGSLVLYKTLLFLLLPMPLLSKQIVVLRIFGECAHGSDPYKKQLQMLHSIPCPLNAQRHYHCTEQL